MREIEYYARLRKKGHSEYEDPKSKALELESKLADEGGDGADDEGTPAQGQADEARLADDRASYTRTEFIDFYGAAQGEAEWRAAGSQPWGRRLVRTPARRLWCADCGAELRDDGYCGDCDQESAYFHAAPRTHRDANHGGGEEGARAGRARPTERRGSSSQMPAPQYLRPVRSA